MYKSAQSKWFTWGGCFFFYTLKEMNTVLNGLSGTVICQKSPGQNGYDFLWNLCFCFICYAVCF
jgi:hypothetical protein